MASVAAFAVFAAVLTVTPGLDTMLVLRTTAVGGRPAGLAAVMGIAVGCLVWAVTSALGVAAVLATSRLAFEVLRVAGVGYLCWLGVRVLWQARSATALPPEAPLGSADQRRADQRTADQSRGRSAGGVRSFRVGLTTNLLNPKVGVFYLSVMPQFLPAGLAPLVGSLLLGAVHVAEGIVWLAMIVLAVNRARGWLTRSSVKRRLDQATGLVFLGFGLRLALERAPR